MKKFLYALTFLLFMCFTLSAQPSLFSDNFDSYNTGQKLAEQATGTEWTTWSGVTGASEDAAISTEQAFSGSNSAKIVTNNDLVLNLGGKTTGRYQVKFQLFVETNKGAFLGFMQDFNGSDTEFGLSVYFNLDKGNIAAGGNEFQFDFPFNKWMLINVIIDLDDDFATIYLDGNEIASWVWSLGSDGTSSTTKLDGIDFWGYTDENGCSNYIDDLEYNQLESLVPPANLSSVLSENDITLSWDAPSTGNPTGYGIVRNNTSIDKTTLTSYDDKDLYPRSYAYSVRAIYGELGYSAPTNIVNETITGGVPENLFYTKWEQVLGVRTVLGAAMGIHELLENKLNFAAVKYHSGDDYEFTEGRARLNYYSISSYPTSKIDGMLTVGGGSNTVSLYDSYKPLYDQRIDIPSTHGIDVEITKIDETNFKAKITVSEEYAYYASDLVLITALTESNIAENWQNQTEVNFACRALYPNANGTVLDFSVEDTQVINLDFTLDASWVPENCELVAFVQYNPTKEIVQAVKTEITAPYLTISITDGSTNVALDEDIVYTFSDPIRHLNNATIAKLDTMIIFKQGSVDGSDVAFTASINDDLNEITIEHDSLEANTTYYVKLSSYIENFYDLKIEDELSTTFTTKSTTGIISRDKIKELTIYPNPFKDKLNLSYFLSEKGKSVIEIYNQSGMLIKTNIQDNSIGSQLIEINTEDLSNGLYFINLKIGNSRISKKVVLLR